jgi:DNA mismatch repair protein MutS2
MNHKSIEELGFFQVLQQIKGMSHAPEGKKVLDALPFLDTQDTLAIRQNQVAAAMKLLSGADRLMLHSFPEIQETLTSLDDPAHGAEGYELLDVARYIRSAEHLYNHVDALQDTDNVVTVLHPLLGDGLPYELVALCEQIEGTLDESGQVRNTHPRISALFRQVETAKSERSRFCAQFIRSNPTAVQTDQEAMRDGRLVIPVRSDRRSQVQGFVSSSSSSGNTVFMEPYTLVEMNNSVMLAQNQILVEIAKILGELNSSVRKLRVHVKTLSTRIGNLDAVFSMALWALETHATATDLQTNRCNLEQARHPLLGNKAVPISITLEEDVRAVVISGPNAGGKTVTIKTVGLFALLNQYCGFIPAKEGSSLPLFDNIFTDIGDEQSIEAELSTFSGHMKQIGYILRNMSKRSLVILDELGSGTDPVEGSAIARSVLEYCLEKAKLTMVTSHHGVLKQFAYAKKEVINASMEFNEHSHMPTFRVIQGLPGESHAIDTARYMKLPEEVISRAEQYLGSEAVQIASIIKDLEEKRKELETQEEQTKKRYYTLQQEVKQLQLKELRVRQKENQLKEEQATELARFMSAKRKELENLVKTVREGELDKAKRKQVKAYVQSLEDRLQSEQALLEQREEELSALEEQEQMEFSEGMEVLCGTAKRLGKILKKQGKNKYLVAIGSMRMTLDGKELQVPKEQQKKVLVSYHSSTPRPKLVLDLRGYTLEEALASLEEQIESCLVHGMSTFSVIHGYGDGILSQGITSYLEHHRAIQGFRFATPEDGGMGKTYVQL